MAMTAAVQRGGGELVSVYATDPQQVSDFRKKFGDVKLAASEDEILSDKSIQLVAGAPIPDQRTPLGLRVMAAGKDYLSDKPAITTLEQLAQVRRAVKETDASSRSCTPSASKSRQRLRRANSCRLARSARSCRR